MVEYAVRNQSGRPRRARSPALDLLASKLRPPLIRRDTVVRSGLIERLATSDIHPIVSVVGPAGYGKTTLLSQWAERSGQAVAWVSVDEKDNDPKVLLTYVAEALDAVEPLSERIFDALTSPGSSVPGSVVPRLGTAFASMTSPVVLVLDDVHVLRNSECRAALPVLADHVPLGSRLVLAGREQPPMRIARLRAEGRLLEIGAGDLALTDAEAVSLLRNAGLALGDDVMAELYGRTEGWAAGLYLAAPYLKEGGALAQVMSSFTGQDRFINEYVEAEFLTRLSRQKRSFLTRASVLERMCGPLCEAVLELPGSAAMLADLEQSNLLLVPLDHRGEWYRYHHLFRDMLLAELTRGEPGLIPVLRRRAAAWCLANDLPEEALEYSMAAEDVDATVRLVARLAVPAYRRARVATVQRWFRWLEDRGGIEDYPLVAVLAAILSALAGRPVDAARWADVVERWQERDPRPEDLLAEAWAALMRAMLCQCGVAQMRADADEAVRLFAAIGFATPTAALLQGIARVLSGDLDGGDAAFQDALGVEEAAGSHEDFAVTFCQRSLVAIDRGEWDSAETLASQARAVLRRVGVEESVATPPICAAHARIALHRGDHKAARQELVIAQRSRPMLTYALPYLAVQTRIELARAHLALADPAGARTLLREIDELFRRRPGLGILGDQAGALRDQLARDGGPVLPGASALTAAELRLLPLLATHLSFPQIGEELFLSRNTIKSQAISIYRKLGVDARSPAVTRARELGLLEG
jgi:LuxR family maltose regulon positive regulatory protein